MTGFRAFLAVAPASARSNDRTVRRSHDGISLGPITISGYARMTKCAMKRLDTVYPTKKQILAYMGEIKATGKSWSHFSNTASALEWLRAYWRDPVKIARPRKPQPAVKEVLSEVEVFQLFDRCKTPREKAIVSLFGYGGLRANRRTRRHSVVKPRSFRPDQPA